MTDKDVLISCIETAPIQGYFSPLVSDGIECDDQLLRVGFKSFILGTTRWFVFKPTMNKLNWIFNFIFPLYRIPYGNKESPIRIHSGFLAGYMTLRDEVHHIVQQDRNIIEYVFCGHSLGGALARIAAVDIQYNYHTCNLVYTLGAPNVGNTAFEDSFKKRISHSHYYINNKDPVPIVPPLFFGYKPYVRTRLPSKYKIKFWLNHLPEVYFYNINNRDTIGEIL